MSHRGARRIWSGWKAGEWLVRPYPLLTEAASLGQDGLSTGAVSEDLVDACRLNDDRMTGDSLPNDRRINQDPDYTVRAWMAAVSYLLSDYRYLYE